MAETVGLPAGFVLDEPQQQGLPEGFQLDAVPDEGFSIAETIQNIPGSAVQLGKDIISPFLSPIETLTNLNRLGQGLVEKAFQPTVINGFSFAQTENAEMVDAIGDFINERYGSFDAFTRTIQEDPVGVLADVAGLFTGGAALLPKTGKIGSIARTVERVGKAVDPLNLAVSGVKSFAKTGKIIPEALPEKLLESALKFRPSIKQKQRANMTKTALREGILPNVKGLRKITDKLDVLDTRLETIISKATERGVSVPKKAVLTELRKLRKDLGGAKVNAASDLKVIDKMASEFDQNLRRLKKDTLTPTELQDLKTDAYNRINFDIRQGSAGFAKNETARAIARRAKELVEEIDPNVQPINRQMGDLLELNTELERVVSRLDNRNLISLDTAVKVGAGAATGTPLGTAVGTGAAVLGAPRVKARTAFLLENLRKNAETVEIINNKLPPVLARGLLTQMGRLNDTIQTSIDEEEEN